MSDTKQAISLIFQLEIIIIISWEEQKNIHFFSMQIDKNFFSKWIKFAFIKAADGLSLLTSKSLTSMVVINVMKFRALKLFSALRCIVNNGKKIHEKNEASIIFSR